MSIAELHIVVSNMQYRLSESDGRTLVRVQPALSDSAAAAQKAGADKGWNRILERTRRSAEAHSLISRYFSL